MSDLFLWLVALCIGLLAGVASGKLAMLVLAQLGERTEDPEAGSLLKVGVMCVAGLLLGVLVRMLLDHPAALAGAVAAFLYFATRVLQSRD